MFPYAFTSLVVYLSEAYHMASQTSESTKGNFKSSSSLHATITIIKINHV